MAKNTQRTSPKSNPDQRRKQVQRILIALISIMIILAMLLSFTQM